MDLETLENEENWVSFIKSPSTATHYPDLAALAEVRVTAKPGALVAVMVFHRCSVEKKSYMKRESL
jgi:hypothetical protein